MEGRLARIYKDLSYGFIRAEKQDYFFHRSDFNGDWSSLASNFDDNIIQYLEFEPTETEKGLRANKVVLSNVVR